MCRGSLEPSVPIPFLMIGAYLLQPLFRVFDPNMVNGNKLGVWVSFVLILRPMQFEVGAIDVGNATIECNGFRHVLPGFYDSRFITDIWGLHWSTDVFFLS